MEQVSFRSEISLKLSTHSLKKSSHPSERRFDWNINKQIQNISQPLLQTFKTYTTKNALTSNKTNEEIEQPLLKKYNTTTPSNENRLKNIEQVSITQDNNF